MKKSGALDKISFKEGSYPFYRDFILETIFNDAQRQAYHMASDAYDNCFLLAKQNNSVASEEAYGQCCTIKETLEPAVAAWVTALCEPRLSYYNYKTKDYQRAILVTEKIIEATQLLQKEGYQTLYFSEVQQLHNLSRIYFTLDETNDAVALSLKCLVGIYERSGGWIPGLVVNGIPEEYIIADAQYAMLVQVMTETFIRILRTFKTDAVLLDHWLKQFIGPLTEIKFSLISADHRYKHVDALVSFLYGMVLNKDEPDYKSLLFVEKKNVDQLLLAVLYEYITFRITENEKEMLVANT